MDFDKYFKKYLQNCEKANPQCSAPCIVSASIGIFTAGPEFCVHVAALKFYQSYCQLLRNWGENISGQVDLKYPPSPKMVVAWHHAIVI